MDVSGNSVQVFVCPLRSRFRGKHRGKPRGHGMTARVEGHAARSIPVELDWLYVQRFDKLAKCSLACPVGCQRAVLPEDQRCRSPAGYRLQGSGDLGNDQFLDLDLSAVRLAAACCSAIGRGVRMALGVVDRPAALPGDRQRRKFQGINQGTKTAKAPP